MLRRQVLGLLLVTHPLPSALYVIATAILAWLAAATLHTQPAAGSLVLALLAVGGAQIAIGSLNDYCDRHLDAEGHRREKPLVSGLIAPWEAAALCYRRHSHHPPGPHPPGTGPTGSRTFHRGAGPRL